jgi:hypothetical protein
VKVAVKGAKAAGRRSLTLALDMDDPELALAVGHATRDGDRSSWATLLETLAKRAAQEAENRVHVFDEDFDGPRDEVSKAARLIGDYAAAARAVALVLEQLGPGPGARP